MEHTRPSFYDDKLKMQPRRNPYEVAVMACINKLPKYIFTIKELETKWDGGHIQNWAMVRNQLLFHDKLKDRVLRYLE
ncbi:hypothetical protein JOC94_000052 [Bacillus thermophilus]|uniref:Transposase n=1 Tax=Siminovitchia thermophila TaxID=1245522 RepID=A0ABS2R381_9BACI|nr:hypothetical protein [Siminovitchia thermophila]ONK24875.1 hypothetical protein BLX87_03330 [Bacillus sp. VT-16-64]